MVLVVLVDVDVDVDVEVLVVDVDVEVLVVDVDVEVLVVDVDVVVVLVDVVVVVVVSIRLLRRCMNAAMAWRVTVPVGWNPPSAKPVVMLLLAIQMMSSWNGDEEGTSGKVVEPPGSPGPSRRSLRRCMNAAMAWRVTVPVG